MTADTTKSAKLSAGYRKSFGLQKPEDDTPSQPPAARNAAARSYFERHKLLENMPTADVRKAWFTLAHLLLRPGARIADMGCGDGTMTYAMAALSPHQHFTGIDSDRKLIAKARKTYSLPNLDFHAEDVNATSGFEAGSLDGIINSFVLHRIYSAGRYDERHVVRALESQFALLREGGQIFIRDYVVPSAEEYVLMEMPDIPSNGKDLKDLSEADLLIWYSEHARPVENVGCQGFFLEELPGRFPQTRLFRLPYKWAYEFIARKDDRENILAQRAAEDAFVTPPEVRKNLRGLGARVLYSAPHWDDTEIQARFDGHFRLYSDDGTPLGQPPTSHIAVAQKMGEKQSLHLHERRPAQKSEGRLRVRAMRNDVTGKIVDVVSRDMDLTEILPYRVTETGELNIFLHEGVPRCIVNAVPRNGKEIDGRRWSGHMMEALAVPTEFVAGISKEEVKDTVLFARDYLGLKPAIGAILEDGPAFFPAPDFIDEHVNTRFLRIGDGSVPATPKIISDDLRGFSTSGIIREISAQAVLNAISVGFIPNSRLELQILGLYDRLGIKAESWEDCPLILQDEAPEKSLDATKFAARLLEGDKRFKDVKGTAGQLRTIQSIFVDEGRVDGSIAGMTSRNTEFIVSDESTLNIAVVLPLTRDLQGKVMAGLCTEFMPIPQRYKGNGLTMTAPCFPLPKEITTVEQAKRFVADKFGVAPDKVSKLGESYFCHVGITPQRIFPFAVASSRSVETPLGGPVQFAPLDYIWNMLDTVLDWSQDFRLISCMRKVYRRLGYDSDLNIKWAAGREGVYEGKTAGIGDYSDMTGKASKVTDEKPAAADDARALKPQ